MGEQSVSKDAGGYISPYFKTIWQDDGPVPDTDNSRTLILQSYIQTPWLDTYFVYTSALGTHTFFTTFLPALFFFGYDEVGRGYVFFFLPFFFLIYAMYVVLRL